MPTTSPCPAASRRSSTFARDAVFTEFRPREARALDQGAFTDHSPQQIRRLHIEAIPRRQAVLERLAAALQQVDVEAGT